MSIFEAIKGALQGDQLLGSTIRREAWMPDISVLVEPHANSMEIGHYYGSMTPYTACIDDILAEDWEMCEKDNHETREN